MVGEDDGCWIAGGLGSKSQAATSAVGEVLCCAAWNQKKSRRGGRRRERTSADFFRKMDFVSGGRGESGTGLLGVVECAKTCTPSYKFHEIFENFTESSHHHITLIKTW